MTACKSATKDKKKTDVRQKALCIQLHSWGHSSQHMQLKTDMPQSIYILMYYQNQCKPLTDTYWKGRRQPVVMLAVWASSHHLQCCHGTPGFCLNFSLGILPTVSIMWTRSCLQHKNHHWKYQWYLHREPESIYRPVRLGHTDGGVVSQSPVNWESWIANDWVTRKKFLNNYLYYKSILKHFVSLCILNRHRRKKRQSGQKPTTGQDRAANSWELLTTHYCLPWACYKTEGRQKPGTLYCPEKPPITMWLSPFLLLFLIMIYIVKTKMNNLSEKALTWFASYKAHLPQLIPFQECLSPFLSLHLGSAIKLSVCSSAILDKDAKSSCEQEQGRKENHSITLLLKITHRKLHSGNSMMSMLCLQK